MARVKHLTRHAVLSDTPAFDAEEGLRVVIETPKGSEVKYAYEPACDCFELKTVMPCGMSFPYDFGFIPSTLGQDGDPMDILMLMDFPVVPGCVLTARLIGVIEAKQREKDGKWERNDRLIGVATGARTHAAVHHLKDLRPNLINEITDFFVDYNRQHGKIFKPLGNAGKHAALNLVKEGQARYSRKHKRK